MVKLIKSDKDYDYYSKLSLKEFEEAERLQYTGKYLLFCGNYNTLMEETINIINISDLTSFRISKVNNGTDDFDNVSAIYDFSNRYSKEIAKRLSPKIKFRYWKSIYKTRNKIYSQQYLSKIQN